MENSTTGAKKTSWVWRILRWGVIGLAGLITLVALLWAEENWHGKRVWEKYKKEWEAKGEVFDWKALMPPPVPDEQNFAMTPFLAPLFDFVPGPRAGESVWRDTNAVQKVIDYGKDMGDTKKSTSWVEAQRTDLTAWAKALDGKKDAPPSGESAAERAAAAKVVLEKMQRYEPVLEELRTASRRQYCRFTLGNIGGDPEAILLPHLAVLKKFSAMYRLRASAELAAGQSDAAMEDIKMGLYLSKALKGEPTLISGLVEIAIVNSTLQPIWEGLADHRWSEAQLKELQGQLEKMDMLAEGLAAFRSDRNWDNAIIDYQRRARHFESLIGTGSGATALNLLPSGWYYQNQLAINQMFQDVFLPPIDAGKHRIYLELSTNFNVRFDQELRGKFMMYTVFSKIMLPAMTRAEQKFANTQVSVDEANIACALERYRLAHGEFPEKLDALSPQFIEKLPTDLITGEPLKYRRTADGQFVLYSVGWNGVDDDGMVAKSKGKDPRLDLTQGDWVWTYPGK